MTVPLEITDPELAKGWAHPLRVYILSLLDRRVASTSELCDELEVPIDQLERHLRALVARGLVRRVRSTTRGGIEHYYTAAVRPTIPDTTWSRMPRIVRRALIDAGLQEAGAQVDAALEAGGFDRDEIHSSRSALRLDATGWTEVAHELERALARVEEIERESEARLARNGAGGYDVGQVVMLFFQRARPTGELREGEATRAASTD